VEKESIVEGLAAGADDYLTKPFHEKELVARVGTGRRIMEMHREIEEKNPLLEGRGADRFSDGLAQPARGRGICGQTTGGAIRHGYPLWVILADLKQIQGGE